PYTGISRNADSRVEHRAAWVREASGRRRRSAGSPGSVRRCDEDGGPQGSGGRGAARVMRAARLTPPRVRAGLPCATRSRGRPGKPGRVRNLESSGERDEDSSVRWASKWRFFFSERAGEIFVAHFGGHRAPWAGGGSLTLFHPAGRRPITA